MVAGRFPLYTDEALAQQEDPFSPYPIVYVIAKRG